MNGAPNETRITRVGLLVEFANHYTTTGAFQDLLGTAYVFFSICVLYGYICIACVRACVFVYVCKYVYS